ncbi:MAG TPA: hypothetical protein VFA60_01730 [Terriglobales bacterium]|nr:hypothetical protein [Terriglobales bacterium]
MRKTALVLVAVALLAAFGWAEGTQTWTQTRFEEFVKGTAKGVAIRSDGTLELAPSFKNVATTPSTYIWAIASDAEGNAYVAAGSPARVYRITPTGQSTVVFQPQELQVQALVADKNGSLYAATSPDGKVYKIERKKVEKGQSAPPPAADTKAAAADSGFMSSVYFDPKTKYIWDMALDGKGQLYLATGDRGEIFRVVAANEGSVFFKSDEAHIRVLAFDRSGNLIAGSDGSGLVYRISPAGEAFVLYSAPRKEITALAVDAQGNIFAAGVGEKRSTPASTSAPSIPLQPPQSISSIGGSGAIVVTATPTPPVNFGTGPSTTAPGGSEVYMIAPDGSPRRIWSGREDIVYALAFDAKGNLVAGTGNRGHVYRVQANGEFTDLVKAGASQVTGFAPAPDGGLYAATSNLGKVFLLGAGPEAEGTYDSDVFDARVFSKWGRAEVRGNGVYEIWARSGNVDNPDRNWSPWKKVDLLHDMPLDVPQARFVQWRAVLRPGPTPPVIESLGLNYRAKNMAPVIEDVAVQTGARFNPAPKISNDNAPVTVGGNQPPAPRFEVAAPATRDRDSIAVRWTARDDNDDQLVYSVYYRGDGESAWKLLKDKVTDKFYSWDAGLLPDGGYTIRVVASDAPSHSPDEALTATKESARFEVDHTPPMVQDLVARVEGGEVHVTFRGMDTFSPIKRAEYSVDAGEWQFVEPVGQLSDAKVENYDFEMPITGVDVKSPEDRTARGSEKAAVPAPKPAEHVIVIRVYDRFDNMGTGKAVFTSK